MKKYQIKAALLALLITITCSGCNRKDKIYDKKEIISIIQENNTDLNDIFELYREIIFSNCSIIPKLNNNDLNILDKIKNYYNDFNFEYAKNYFNYYIKFLKNNIDVESPNIYLNSEKMENGMMEELSFENSEDKYNLTVSKSLTYKEEKNTVLTSYENRNHRYNISFINKYNKKIGTKNYYLNTVDNSITYSYSFFKYNSLTISLINNNIFGYDDDKIKINENEYKLIILDDNLFIEKEISEYNFNKFLIEMNYMNENNMDYGIFAKSELDIAKEVVPKINGSSRTRNK